MRSAGCTWNDIVDRRLDAAVTRTAGRPIPAGEVSVAAALAFAILLSLGGLIVLREFNSFTIGLGIASLLPVALYPFAKRVTWWPQVVLGLTFNWGALMGWAAARGGLDAAPMLLYVGAVFWTLGYDTIYAHQDRRDDSIAGIRSTARRLGGQSRRWIGAFYLVFLAALTAAGMAAHLAWPYFLGVLAAGLHFAWQVRRFDADDPSRCLALFRANVVMGWFPFLGALWGKLV
ncbi:MAG: 4-hydroxybenzoate octaprenyltransferase [Alphaproteobacteria bacterium]|nr:MAG: 4-hydroxybenzoate octaprenyltransferase [Alphaproteobacteria bacterium]